MPERTLTRARGLLNRGNVSPSIVGAGWTFIDTFTEGDGIVPDVDRYDISGNGTGHVANIQGQAFRLNAGSSTGYVGQSIVDILDGWGDALNIGDGEIELDLKLSNVVGEVYYTVQFRINGGNYYQYDMTPFLSTSILKEIPANIQVGSNGNLTFPADGQVMLSIKYVGSDIQIFLWDKFEADRATLRAKPTLPSIHITNAAIVDEGSIKFIVNNGGGAVGYMDVNTFKVRTVVSPTWVHPSIRGGWYTTFFDDFNSPVLNTSNWVPYEPLEHWETAPIGSRNWRQGSLAWDTEGPNLSITNGALTILTKQEAYTGRVGNGDASSTAFSYTSGVVASYGKYDFMYGYVEVRCRLSAGSGPGFWPFVGLVPSDLSDKPQFDIIAALTNKATLGLQAFYSTSVLHALWSQIDLTQYHTYGVEWNEFTVTYTLDGIAILVTDVFDPNETSFILLTTMVSATFPPDSTTVFPAKLDIDWIRVQQTDAVTGPVGSNLKYDLGSASPESGWSSQPIGTTGSAFAPPANAGLAQRHRDGLATPSVPLTLTPNSRQKITEYSAEGTFSAVGDRVWDVRVRTPEEAPYYVGKGVDMVAEYNTTLYPDVTATLKFAETQDTSGGPVTTFTTQSWTPSVNKLYIVDVLLCRADNTNAVAPVLTGNGLTYVDITPGAEAQYDDTGTNRARMYRFRALKTSGLSAGAITVTPGSGSYSCCQVYVTELSNVDTSGTNGSGALVQTHGSLVNSATPLANPTITLSALTAPKNAVLGVVTTSTGYSVSGLFTGGTGFGVLAHLEDYFATGAPDRLSSLEFKAPGQNIVNWTRPAGDYGVIASEIKAASNPVTLNGTVFSHDYVIDVGPSGSVIIEAISVHDNGYWTALEVNPVGTDTPLTPRVTPTNTDPTVPPPPASLLVSPITWTTRDNASIISGDPTTVQLTKTGTATYMDAQLGSFIAVTGNTDYAARAEAVAGTVSRAVYIAVEWFGAAGLISADAGSAVNDATGAGVAISLLLHSPLDATGARILYRVLGTPAVGEVHTAQYFAFRQGIDVSRPSSTGSTTPPGGGTGGTVGQTGANIDSTLKPVTAVHCHQFNLSCGVSGHYPYDNTHYANANAVMNGIGAIGLTVWRDGWRADTTEITKSNTMWGYAQQQYATYGIRLVYLADPRSFAAGADNTYATLVNRFKIMCDKLKERVLGGFVDKNAIIGFEYPNETDAWISGAQMSQFITDTIGYLKAMLVAIGRPDMEIIAPSMYAAQDTSHTGAIGNKSGMITMNNAHDYPGGVAMTLALMNLTYAATNLIVPGGRVFTGETDFSNGMTSQVPPTGDQLHPPRSEADCVWLTPDNYFIHFADPRWWVCCKYEALKESASTNSWEGSFGILENDFTLTPAGKAMQNLLRKTADLANVGFKPLPLVSKITGYNSNTVTKMMCKGDGKNYQLGIMQQIEATTSTAITLTLAAGVLARFRVTRVSPTDTYETPLTGLQNSITFDSRRELALVDIILP